MWRNISTKKRGLRISPQSKSCSGVSFMTSTEIIREKIRALYKSNPDIHMNVALTHPRLNLENASVRITGVYRNIFQVEDCSEGKPKRHTMQYSDVLVRHIVIAELENGK